jgi:glycosyltransferase involved in cell wall biosynthesis
MTAPHHSSLPVVSVVLCTYRPNQKYLTRVLESLGRQNLPAADWELVLVDSASPEPVSALTQLPWPSRTKFVRAPEPGLALARKLGADAATSALIAFIDDDTVLAPDYLAAATAFLAHHTDVGAVSGRLSPEFEVPPPPWIREFNSLLALRDFGPTPLLSALISDAGAPLAYPEFAPIGPNVCRRNSFQRFLQQCEKNPVHFQFGRKGASLASGEDNDFVISVLKAGERVAYCPDMHLTHLIPARRIDSDYLARLNRASSRTWVQVLLLNGISSWPSVPAWTVPLRKLRAWFTYRAWRGPLERIRWQGACGHFEGRAGKPTP